MMQKIEYWVWKLYLPKCQYSLWEYSFQVLQNSGQEVSWKYKKKNQAGLYTQKNTHYVFWNAVKQVAVCIRYWAVA
jgi:hypothetical protein